MKRIVKSFAIAAVSALAFISCSQEQNPVSKDNGIHFTIRTSENPLVKSFIESDFEGRYIPKWSKGDELAMFVGAITEATKPTGILTNLNNDGELATFDGKVTGIEETGTFKSFTPASAFAISYKSGNIGVTLAEVQKPSSLTIDEACDILVAKETSYMADATGKVTIDNLFFKRMFSVVKVALKGPESLNGEKVSKFSLTAPEGTVLTGRAAINLATATIDKWNISNNSVTATYEADAPIFGGGAGLENEVWLVVNPGTIESGAKVVFAGETANYTFSKEVTLSKALTFPESQLAVINLTLAEENCTKKAAGNAYVLHEDELIEGDYLVVYGGKAMKASVTSNRLAYSDVTVNNNTIANSDESIVWHISQSGGYWTISNNNKYAASTGTKNQAQLLDKGSDDKSLWTVTKTVNASTFEFVNKANSTAGVNANLRNNGTYGFACYATSTGGPLSLYRLSGPIDNTIPTLSVDQTSKIWAADATDAFIVNVAVNSEGGDWTVTPKTLSWATIAVDKAAGTITITPNGANETETANEATLTVTHTTDASLKAEVSLKQNGKGGAERYFVKVTTAPTDWSGTYLIVYETGNVAFDGSLAKLDVAKNTVAVTISENKIEATDALMKSVFTIDGTAIKSASGKYISGKKDTNSLIETTKQDHTLSIDKDGNFSAVSNTSVLRYNSTSTIQNNKETGLRFRYYKATSYSSQKAIQLYKLVN